MTINEVLSAVFGKLTKNCKEFFEYKGLKIGEVNISGKKIGVGINNKNSIIELYECCPKHEDVFLRFKQLICRISILPVKGEEPYLNVFIDQNNLVAKIHELSSIYEYMININMVVEMIDIDYQKYKAISA